MRVVIQRVSEAKVIVAQEVKGQIGQGLLILLGIHQDDQPQDVTKLIKKIVSLRLFSDENGKMNLSIADVRGSILVVSQFTLYGNCANGRRPDFIQAASPAIAIPLYEQFVEEVRTELGHVQTGEFGAKMEVSLVNDGPVTFILDSSSLK